LSASLGAARDDDTPRRWGTETSRKRHRHDGAGPKAGARSRQAASRKRVWSMLACGSLPRAIRPRIARPSWRCSLRGLW